MTEKAPTAVSYIMSGMFVFGGLTINEWLAVTGIILGVATFAMNWFYKHKHYKLAVEKKDNEK